MFRKFTRKKPTQEIVKNGQIKKLVKVYRRNWTITYLYTSTSLFCGAKFRSWVCRKADRDCNSPPTVVQFQSYFTISLI